MVKRLFIATFVAISPLLAIMALPGFHDIETVGQKFAELINDGQNHQGEFIELYPIVKED